MTEDLEGKITLQMNLITTSHPIENAMKVELFVLLHQSNVTTFDYILM